MQSAELISAGAGVAGEVTAVMASWSREEPTIGLGDHVVFVTHRPVDGDAAEVPERGRYKVHSSALGDRSRLVTLIIHVQGGTEHALYETVVSTAPGGGGEVLARGFGNAGQPVILVFKLAAREDFEPAS
jgi:hypothetical protein